MLQIFTAIKVPHCYAVQVSDTTLYHNEQMFVPKKPPHFCDALSTKIKIAYALANSINSLKSPLSAALIALR